MQPTFEQVLPVLYKGWDQTAARADFNVGGWRNKAGAEQFVGGGQAFDPDSRADQIIADSQRAFQQDIEEVAKQFGEFKQTNPFRIDEVLAAKGAEAREQIDPFYNETLSDYLLGVTRKIGRGRRDTKDLLSELSAQTESFTGNAQFKLNEAINRAQQGFAESGLFTSGERFRTEGKLERATGEALSEFEREQTGRERRARFGEQDFLEDIGLERKQQVRGLERSRLTDVEQRKSQLAKESGQQFISGFRATLPPRLQAASGFDLLSDLGIFT